MVVCHVRGGLLWIVLDFSDTFVAAQQTQGFLLLILELISYSNRIMSLNVWLGVLSWFRRFDPLNAYLIVQFFNLFIVGN